MKNKIKHLLGIISTVAISLMLFPSFSAFAEAASSDSGNGNSGGLGSYTSIIMIVVLIAVFYFFMIRPEQKKKKKTEEMRNSLGVGDKITTIGGMVGKIVELNGDLITFETGEDRVRIQVTKWAISTNSIQKKEEDAK